MPRARRDGARRGAQALLASLLFAAMASGTQAGEAIWKALSDEVVPLITRGELSRAERTARLDAAVRAVPHPAREAEFARLSHHVHAKPHALYASPDPELSSHGHGATCGSICDCRNAKLSLVLSAAS